MSELSELDWVKRQRSGGKPERYLPQIGDLVTTVMDGRITDYDPESMIWTLRGNTRGAQHLDWNHYLHWGTEFEPYRPC